MSRDVREVTGVVCGVSAAARKHEKAKTARHRVNARNAKKGLVEFPDSNGKLRWPVPAKFHCNRLQPLVADSVDRRECRSESATGRDAVDTGHCGPQ